MSHKILYVAQPMNVYQTPLQAEMLGFLKQRFPDWVLENPDQPHHHEGFMSYQRERDNPMAYFEEKILPHINGCVGLTFGDGTFPAGVGYELMRSFAKGHPVWTLQLHEDGFVLTQEDRFPRNFLTIAETVRRVFSPQGGFLPYE